MDYQLTLHYLYWFTVHLLWKGVHVCFLFLSLYNDRYSENDKALLIQADTVLNTVFVSERGSLPGDSFTGALSIQTHFICKKITLTFLTSPSSFSPWLPSSLSVRWLVRHDHPTVVGKDDRWDKNWSSALNGVLHI